MVQQLTEVFTAERVAGMSPQDVADLLNAQASRVRGLEFENEVLRERANPSRPAKGRSPPEWRFRVRGYEWVETQLWARGEPAPKMVPTLRVYVPLEDQPDGPGYWDFTRKRLTSTLEPLLPNIVGTDTVVIIRQIGKGYRSFDTMRVVPPGLT